MRRIGPGLLAVLLGSLLATPAGAQPPVPSPRIVNGLPTSDFASVGAIVDALGSFCTATLVGCRTVLTAAHCLCQSGNTGAACPDGTQLPQPSQILFFLQHAGFFSVNDIRVHPSYGFQVSSDFAVLELDVPVRGVAPSPINTVATPPYGTAGTIVGFGRTSGALTDSGVKRFGAVTTAACVPSVPEPAHVCWNFVAPIGPPGDDSNTCFGDSGGPLFEEVGTVQTVIGVHSGAFDPTCQAPDSAFDANVFDGHTWIEDQGGVDLSEACGDGPSVGDPSVGLFASDGSLGGGSSQDFEQLTVPAGTQLLRVGLNGEDGNTTNDFDLYVRFGAPPTTTVFDCASTFTGTFEFCEIPLPTPGTWYVLIDRFAGGGDWQLTATLLPENPAPPPLVPGDIVVSDFASSEIFRADAASGDRDVASSPLRGAGATPLGPQGLVALADGTVYANDRDRRTLFRVDPVTGDRSVISGCADEACSSAVGTGPGFDSPRLVARESDGRLLVTDVPPSPPGVVLRVDPATGDRTRFSGPGLGSGPSFVAPLGLAVEADDDVLVADATFAAVFRVDPVTGDRTILSGCADPGCTQLVGAGPRLVFPLDLALDASGNALVTDADLGSFRALVRVDTTTGDRSRISGCLDDACTSVVGGGPNFTSGLSAVAVENTGDVLVTDFVANAVFRVDPATGDRTVHSGCEDAACSTAAGAGTLLTDPIGVVVVPEPGAWLSLGAGIAYLAALAARRRSRGSPGPAWPGPRS